jgi:hypothetical protein
MKKIIIKLNTSNSLQTSPEGVKINKIVSSISPINFIKLLRLADNKVNPRTAKKNPITDSICETLETSPELFLFKSKGILISTEYCKVLDRNRVEISLDQEEYEGIMDGGHNTLAIAIHLIKELFDKKIKTWSECKEFWDNNYDEILIKFQEKENHFNFSIPIEIITPNGENGSLEEFLDFIAEICSARNNNVQLTEVSKGNKVGYYDHLKESLNGKFEVIWRSGESGKIRAEDVISLASLPLIFLKNNNLLSEDIKGLNKISIYSQKSRCVDFFNSVMDHKSVTTEDKGEHKLYNTYVQSALSLTKDILVFFDRMYIKFPELYHSASPGRFGGINQVEKTPSKVPFYSTDETSEYKYPFGYFYPLVSGLTSLMEIDEQKEIVKWKVNPANLDLSLLNLTQYVSIIKIVNFDPQKVGKGEFFYREAENTFDRISVN